MDSKINQKGFTLVELLIATAVLSTVLVTATLVMTGIGNLYYKGINQAKIQNNVRSIVSDLTDQLELYDQNSIPDVVKSPDGDTSAYCINGIRYTFILGKQLKETPTETDQIKHVLWRDQIGAADCQPTDGMLNADTPSPNGQELMTPNSRLTLFEINPTTSPFGVNVGAVYGDKDLISGGTLNVDGGRQGSDVRCLGGFGGSFCAVSYLNTNIARRLGR